MRQRKWLMSGLVLAGALGFSGALWAESGAPSSSGQADQPSAFGRSGNQGQGFSEDQTIKGGGKLPESTPQQDAQITLGGSRPTVMGEVLSVSGEDYTIRDKSGSEVRFRITKDTSMDCARGAGEGTIGRQDEMPGKQDMSEGRAMGDQSGTQSRSTLGKDSSQDVAKGSGFVVGPKGGCSFKAGDHVKAEVSDLGTALFVKRLDEGKKEQGEMKH